jgi:ribosomal-protein-alanine N-acetyltransferase
VIGAAGFKGRPDARGAVDIGYGILPPWRRRGLATEAARALVDHVRDDPAVQRVTADCRVDNPASIRVLERLGLTRVDRRAGLIYWELELP